MRYRADIFLLKLLLLFAASFTLNACDGEGITGVESTVVNSSSKLQQLLLIVNLSNSNNHHIVLDRIDSVKLKVNGQKWGIFSSDQLDIADIPTTLEGSVNVTDSKIGYLVIANYTLVADSLETAGDFAAYLHDRLRLKPGDYICEVAEVQFRDAADNIITVKPHIYLPFTVEPDVSSLFLGEINVTVN